MRKRFLPNDYVNEKKDHHKTHLSLELLYANNYLCCRSMIKRRIREVYFYSPFPLLYFIVKINKECMMCLHRVCFVPSCIMCLHRVYFVSSCINVSSSCMFCVCKHLDIYFMHYDINYMHTLCILSFQCITCILNSQ